MSLMRSLKGSLERMALGGSAEDKARCENLARLINEATPDGEALNDLGCDYLRIRGAERLARVAFLAAARRGSIHALYNLGYIHWYGKGVPANERKALAWNRAAAYRGYLDAWFEMGRIYVDTDDDIPAHMAVPRDLEAARAIYAFAADRGHLDATCYLGILFLTSDFKGYDEAQGLYLLMDAAARGSPLAANHLAAFFDGPRFGPDDPGNLMRDFWRGYRARRDAICDDPSKHQEN